MSTASLLTGEAVRAASRANALTTPTSGLAQGFIQANLLVLPSRYADDFRQLCVRNPAPCPLLAESAEVGSFSSLRSHLAPHVSLIAPSSTALPLDLRRDCPKYNLYRDSKLIPFNIPDLLTAWTPDHVAFLIGCSFSFESALTAAGLPPPHVRHTRNVPMYRTTRPLCPSGVFTHSTHVVSMRMYHPADIERVRAITRRFALTHGEPIAWGWEAVSALGIQDLRRPEWGDEPVWTDGRGFGEKGETEETGEVPVFWGCGVTTQEAVFRAGLEGTIMAHAPGHMLVLDCRDDEIVLQ